MAAMVRALNKLFEPRYLLATNVATSGLLMGLADLAIQTAERVQAEEGTSRAINWHRTGRLVVIGLALGPFNHWWYKVLDRVLPGVGYITVGKKILADQTVASPYFSFTFFMGAGLLEGHSVQRSWDEFCSKFWQVYKVDWMFWPAAQALNFTAVPSQFRVVYVFSAALCWNGFLSHMKFKDSDEDKEAAGPDQQHEQKPPKKSTKTTQTAH